MPQTGHQNTATQTETLPCRFRASRVHVTAEVAVMDAVRKRVCAIFAPGAIRSTMSLPGALARAAAPSEIPSHEDERPR